MNNQTRFVISQSDDDCKEWVAFKEAVDYIELRKTIKKTIITLEKLEYLHALRTPTEANAEFKENLQKSLWSLIDLDKSLTKVANLDPEISLWIQE